MNSMIDHSSDSRFSTGVPVSAIRVAAGRARDRPGLLGGVVLDVLRLVADHPGPGQRAQRGLVPGGDAVAGDDQVRLGQGRGSDSPSSRSAPWCTWTRRSGVNRAASRCQLPTSDIGHTSRVGPDRGLRGDQRQQLDRLAQAHVVGQDAAQAEARRGRTARTARAPGRAAASRRSPRARPSARSRRSACPDSRSPSQPSASTPTSGTSGRRASPAASASAAVIVPGLVALQELQRGLQVRLVQLDPLAAQPDQRDLEPGQLGQLGRVERLVADRHVVPEVHQVAQAEPRPGDRRARRGSATGWSA